MRLNNKVIHTGWVVTFHIFFFCAFNLEDEPQDDVDDNDTLTVQTTRLTPLLHTCGPYLSRKCLSPLGQQGGQSVWVTGGMFPSSSSSSCSCSSSSSSSALWPPQDTSSEIMGLCSWLISSFMAHVCGHFTSIQRAAMTGPVKVGSGELTRHKSTTTSRTEALLSGFSSPREALQTPL